MTKNGLVRIGWVWTQALAVVGVVAAITLLRVPATAQAFNSGSDGSDGAFTIAATQGTIIFDPTDTARWGRVLDADGDGVYNFTTFTIGAGTTLRLRGDKVNRPMYFLATGAVTVSGTIDLSGSDGIAADMTTRREVAVPGPGGYAGGAAGYASPSVPATPGEGPGGGVGGVSGTPNCNNYGISKCGRGATFGGSRFLLPLIGGSGGEGGVMASVGNLSGNGGAGGGALLIASSTAITVNGSITATGGRGGITLSTVTSGGGGSGGGVRLVAPVIDGSGTINVSAVVGPSSQTGVTGGSGWVRLESNQPTSLNIVPSSNAVSHGGLGHPSTLRPPYSIRITAIDGKPVSPSPTGMVQLPDVTISNGAPVSVEIKASGIPSNTVVTLQVYPEAPVDPLAVNLTVDATLLGTMASSTATVTIAFPFGTSRAWVRASWTQ